MRKENRWQFNKAVCGLFIAASLLCFIGGTALAYSLDLNKINKIPLYDSELSYEQFLENSKLIKEEPEQDKALAYEIRLPQDWRVSSNRDLETQQTEETETEDGKKLTRRILGKVARYGSAPRIDFESYIDVRAIRLSYDISAQNWFIDYILSRGYTLQGMRKVTDTKFEALYNMVEDGIPYVVRTLAVLNGPRIIFVSYYLPEKYWMEERAIQQHVLASFKFYNPEPVEEEKTLSYSFYDLLTFDYPVSWVLDAPNIYSIDAMEAKVISTSDDRVVNGAIDISIVATDLDTTLAKEIGYVKEDLREMGFEVGEIIKGDREYKFNDHIFFSRVETYKLMPKRNLPDHELWLAILVEDRYYYIVTLLTPSREYDFNGWARNLEAFEIVIESFRV